MSRSGTLLSSAALAVAVLGVPAATLSQGSGEREPGGEVNTTRLGTPPEVRGVALGLFADRQDHDYTPQLREIAALGASHVAIVVTWFQRDIHSTEIWADPRRTPSSRATRDAIRAARRAGLAVMLFPYVSVDQQLEPSHWRGTIAPSDRDAWFAAYSEWIVGLARTAEEEGVQILSIGSEMSSVDIDTERWVEIIRRVRQVFHGRLTYSANWDHHERVEFWDQLDIIGLTGYFELVPRETMDPTIDEVIEGWREWHVRLMRWQSHRGRPILFTEVGYRSNDGASAYPWRWGDGEDRVDLEEQRRLYEAFTRVWSDEPRLAGVFFWNWWGEGGPTCHDYTPRGKPAEGVLREWFAQEDTGETPF
jgi:hypothetical protein